ncbi:MAG: FliA/WhiG family RNA polymerase sigma factor [Deltaproteobacteria bacterium]|nr:FliA/WhiG family RNA polymerase sigma factor [Deltaproteobacteria bacterium]
MKKHMAAQVQANLTTEQWPAQVDASWQEYMVVRYAPLIKYIASRLALRLPSHISLDDLISSGILGLIDAIQKFDPGKNISFKTYAEFRIKGAILDELRSLDWIPRSVRKKSHQIEKAYAELERHLGRPAEAEEVSEALGLDLEEFYQLLDETKSVSLVDLEGVWKSLRSGPELSDSDLPEILLDENQRDPFLALHFSELQDLLVRAIETLPDKEKLLISLYYYEELTMKEVGQIMGYTESRISQLHTQAMLRLRGRLREHVRLEAR